jgi:hypothetical protein
LKVIVPVAPLVAPDKVEAIELAPIATPVVPVTGADTLVLVVVRTVTVLVNPVVAVHEAYRAVILYLYVPAPGESVQLKLPNAFGLPLLEGTGLQDAAPRSVPFES